MLVAPGHHDEVGTNNAGCRSLSAGTAKITWDGPSFLLELNHERYAEEVKRGLHDKKERKPATEALF